MPRMLTEGERQPPVQRTRRAAWLIIAFAVLLIGFPLGFVLLAGGASAAWFTGLYVALAMVAVAAALFFASGRRGRLRTP